MSEISEAFNRSFEHPEFWWRFALIAIGVLLVMRGRALVYRRATGSRFSPWVEGVQTVSTMLMLIVFLVDWGWLLKASAILIWGMLWTIWDAWREQRAKVRSEARDGSGGPIDAA